MLGAGPAGAPGPGWPSGRSLCNSPGCNPSLSHDSRMSVGALDGGVHVERMCSSLLPLKTSLCDGQGAEGSENVPRRRGGDSVLRCPRSARSDAVAEC